MSTANQHNKLELAYTIFCDDVRLEVGNKLSLIGVFQNMLVQQTPISLIKFAIVNHWRGDGRYLSEVRILSPDRKQPVVVSEPAPFEITHGGHTDNVSFFVNVTFPAPGEYWVQTLINSTLFDEQPLLIIDARAASQPPEAASEAIN
ncbi:MAG TPA: hypothetical protein VEY11_08325 [Pyrinomonadaceae bacterium]|nr:hypothetical protein [Pyrinomonadaceae bacterium]